MESTQSLDSSRQRNILTNQQLQNKFNELYNESNKRKDKKQKQMSQIQEARSMQFLQECTFRPKINPQNHSNCSKKQSFIARQEDWLTRKQKKIEQLQRRKAQKQLDGCTFHPFTLKNSFTALKQSRKMVSQAQSDNKAKQSYRQLRKKKQIESKNEKQLNLMTQKRKQQRETMKVKKQQQDITQTQNKCKGVNYLSKLKRFSPHEQNMNISSEGKNSSNNNTDKIEEQNVFSKIDTIQQIQEIGKSPQLFKVNQNLDNEVQNTEQNNIQVVGQQDKNHNLNQKEDGDINIIESQVESDCI